MAQKTIVELTDDLDGGKAAETVQFGLDGRTYTIDLNARNAKALRKILAPYVESGRHTRSNGPRGTGTRARTGTRTGARTAPARRGPDPQAVRDWARSQGIEVAERGRIPTNLAVQFQAAHS